MSASQNSEEIRQSTMNDSAYFFNNPDIQLLGQQKRWTVSVDLPDNENIPERLRGGTKVPLNIQALRRNRIHGAYRDEESCLATLDESMQILPQAGNNAFFIKSTEDGLMILDIEKTCPADIAQSFIDTLPWTYAEYSLSGKGYHLLLPLPDNYYDFPHAMGNVALKDDNGHYEILMHHFVTFSRNPIDNPTPPKASNERNANWSALYEQLASKVKRRLDVSEIAIEIEDLTEGFEHRSTLINLVHDEPYRKTPYEFDNDMSKFEWGLLNHIYFVISRYISEYNSQSLYSKPRYDSDGQLVRKYEPIELTDQQMIAICYASVHEYMEVNDMHREKHTTTRNGLPFLLDQSKRMIEARKVQEKNEREEREREATEIYALAIEQGYIF